MSLSRKFQSLAVALMSLGTFPAWAEETKQTVLRAEVEGDPHPALIEVVVTDGKLTEVRSVSKDEFGRPSIQRCRLSDFKAEEGDPGSRTCALKKKSGSDVLAIKIPESFDFEKGGSFTLKYLKKWNALSNNVYAEKKMFRLHQHPKNQKWIVDQRDEGESSWVVPNHLFIKTHSWGIADIDVVRTTITAATRGPRNGEDVRVNAGHTKVLPEDVAGTNVGQTSGASSASLN